MTPIDTIGSEYREFSRCVYFSGNFVNQNTVIDVFVDLESGTVLNMKESLPTCMPMPIAIVDPPMMIRPGIVEDW